MSTQDEAPVFPDKAGIVHLKASTTGQKISGKYVSEQIRSLLRGPTACSEVHLDGYEITGTICLQRLGSEGKALPLLVLESLRFSSLDLQECWLSGLRLKNCEIIPDEPETDCTGVQLRGAHCLGTFEVDGVKVFASNSSILCSCTKFRLGCYIKNIGSTELMPGIDQQKRSLQPLRYLDLSFAEIFDGLELSGVSIESSAGKSLNADEIVVHGHVHFLPSAVNHPCHMVGEVSFRGTHIYGHVGLVGVHLKTGSVQVGENAYAFVADDSVIEGGLLFHNSKESSLRILGALGLIGIQVGGNLELFGTFNSLGRLRSIKARGAQIKGAVQFGWASKELKACSIDGECDFSNASVGGRFIVAGAQLRLARNVPELPHVARRISKYALNLKNSTIKDDLLIEGSQDRRCVMEGLGLIGALIGGRLVIRGVDLIAGAQDNSGKAESKFEGDRFYKEALHRKAISANGVVIRGGVFIEGDLYSRAETIIRGEIRLRNATVNGPFILTGTEILVPQKPGIALWATNAHFGSDFILKRSADTEASESQPASKGKNCCFEGEVRLAGSIIDGSLLIYGARLKALHTGCCLDCYRAQVKSDIFIGDAKIDSTHSEPAVMLGMVNFEFAEATSMTLGVDFSGPPSLDQDDNPVQEALSVYGAVIMRNLKLRGTMLLANAKLRSVDVVEGASLDLPAPYRAEDAAFSKCLFESWQKQVRAALAKHSVLRKNCIVHAAYAQLGTRMYVRLYEGSAGLINLYGASTGAIGPATFSDPDRITGTIRYFKREDWGKPPKKQPACEEDCGEFVYLNLAEFTYQYISDNKEPGKDNFWHEKDNESVKRRRAIAYMFGRPRPTQLLPRVVWFKQQVVSAGMDESSTVAPQRQLAQTYRAMGKYTQATKYIRERRWLQQTQRRFAMLDWLFGAMFGYGYSSLRASFSLLALFLLSFAFTFSVATAPIGPGQSIARYMPWHSGVVPVRYNTPIAHWSGWTGSWVDTTAMNVSTSARTSTCAFSAYQTSQHDHRRSAFFYSTVTEAFKLILPFTRFEKEAGCSLEMHAGNATRFTRALIVCLSWILFPLAAITYSGLLREQ